MKEFEILEKQLEEEIKVSGRRIVNGDMVTYRTILKEGYLGDFATEWWTQEDYDRHAKHVEELKAKGTFGKPWICDLTLKHNPLYDEPSKILPDKSLESYRMTIIDLSTGESKEIKI